MDPVTQGTLGAAVALAVLPRFDVWKKEPWSYERIALIGALGGMAPDLDVLIRSAEDSLLAIEYHRHFTHSLAFIPIGGALAAAPWLCFRHWRGAALSLALTSTLGYATHAVLDACTTYGTLLLWPFSRSRVSLSYISVIDLVYTLPLLLAVIVGIRRRSQPLVWAGLAWSLLYMAFGAIQHQRAMTAVAAMAQTRAHIIERADVFPSLANNVTWRSIYRSAGKFYVDKVRVTWDGRACVTPGASVPVPPPLNPAAPKAARGYSLLRWFADDWAAFDPDEPAVFSDLRYSFAPNEVSPIWGVRFETAGIGIHNPSEVNAANDAVWVNHRARRRIDFDGLTRLWFEDGTDARCF